MRLSKLILAGGLLVVLAAYSMGWSGTLHFDDEPNLDGLSGISDFASGLQFVFSGESGPTGRPLSLATFALQHESWPDPTPFLIFNTVLHILNAVLCFLLLRRLLGWMLEDRRAAEWLAVIVTLVWAASPFLASANLIVVQRMTGLSAFFALLALNIYTIARTGYRPDSWRANLWLASIAGIGTLLAGLAKENGFLAAGVSAADRVAAGAKGAYLNQAAAQGFFLGCIDCAGGDDSGISADAGPVAWRISLSRFRAGRAAIDAATRAFRLYL